MPLLAALLIGVILAMVFGPNLWAKWTLSRHGGDRPDFPGTGSELARHLLDEAGLQDVKVETVPQGDHCMHEFVATAAELKRSKNVSAMDLAKRLLDYGFHAPTVYFPLTVKESIMIEPTETESKETLDAFADALKAIEEAHARLDEVNRERTQQGHPALQFGHVGVQRGHRCPRALGQRDRSRIDRAIAVADAAVADAAAVLLIVIVSLVSAADGPLTSLITRSGCLTTV